MVLTIERFHYQQPIIVLEPEQAGAYTVFPEVYGTLEEPVMSIRVLSAKDFKISPALKIMGEVTFLRNGNLAWDKDLVVEGAFLGQIFRVPFANVVEDNPEIAESILEELKNVHKTLWTKEITYDFLTRIHMERNSPMSSRLQDIQNEIEELETVIHHAEEIKTVLPKKIQLRDKLKADYDAFELEYSTELNNI